MDDRIPKVVQKPALVSSGGAHVLVFLTMTVYKAKDMLSASPKVMVNSVAIVLLFPLPNSEN